MSAVRSILRYLTGPVWAAMGAIALLLGLIGVVLPVLPTTPFVILAAFCFAKGSPRFERMLVEHRVFGPMIADWRRTGAIAPRYKAMALLMMAAAFALSLWMGLPGRVLAIQAVALTGAALFILTRPGA